MQLPHSPDRLASTAHCRSPLSRKSSAHRYSLAQARGLHRVVDLAPVDTSAPLVLPPSLSHINIKANLYAERGAKCAVPECYTPGATDPPACLQKMCALGQLIEQYSSSETLAVTLKASVMSAKGGAGMITLSTDLEMYGDRTQQLDRAAMFRKRDTTMWSSEEYQLLHPNPLGGLIYNELEIMDTIEESVLPRSV